MANIPVISFADADPILKWSDITTAIEQGHSLPRAKVADSFTSRDTDTLLTRSAWIDGLGLAVKAATVFPNYNPSINGGVLIFKDDGGALEAVIDFHLLTKWKTVGDSLLGATKLARTDSQHMVIMGAGTVAGQIVDAYRSIFPNLQISIWNRSPERAIEMARKHDCDMVNDLPTSIQNADIIACASMTSQPILHGEWVTAGTHIDLIGAYRSDMREADDNVMTNSRIFVDSRETTISHIGEIKDPIERGIITPNDIIADYYDLQSAIFKRQSDDEITVFKNGGGAHMDLMVAKEILRAVNRA